MSLAVRALVWGALGAVVAVPLDALHVVTGAITYATPRMGLQDWWVIPLFFAAGVGLGLGHRLVAMRLAGGVDMPGSTWLSALGGLLLLIAVYASSGFLQPWPLGALGLYTASFLISVALVDRRARPALLLHAAGAALSGPLVEILLSSAGAFWYNDPDFLGIALWTPGIYLNAAAASHLVDRAFLRSERGG